LSIYGSFKTIQVKEKKKGRHGRIVSDCHGYPLVRLNQGLWVQI
jgi:hypothetical protein